MSLYLPCDCKDRGLSRFIRHEKTGPVCSRCGTPALEGAPPAKRYHQLDVDYDCPITGRPIRSKRAHLENLSRHGCHVLEPGELEDAKRHREAADREIEAKLEQTAEELVASLPEDKRKALETEAIASDLQVTRG